MTDVASESSPRCIAVVHAVLFDYGHTLTDFTLAEDELLLCYMAVRSLLEAEARQELPSAESLIKLVSQKVTMEIAQSYEAQDLQELDIVELFSRALSDTGLELPRGLVESIAEMEHRALVRHLEMPKENLAVLRTLRSEGIKVGLVSNATYLPRLLHEDLDRLGISRLVDIAVFSSEIGVRKPHPAIFRQALDGLDVAPHEAVFVGDRLRDDIGGAQSLGMRTVLTTQYRRETLDGSKPHPDAVIGRLPELIDILKAFTTCA